MEEKHIRDQELSLPPVAPKWANFFVSNKYSKLDSISRLSPLRSKSQSKTAARNSLQRVFSNKIVSNRELNSNKKHDIQTQFWNKDSVKDSIQQAITRIQPGLPFSNRNQNILTSNNLSELIITGNLPITKDTSIFNPIFKPAVDNTTDEVSKHRSSKALISRQFIDPDLIPNQEKKIDLKELSAYMNYSSKKPFKC